MRIFTLLFFIVTTSLHSYAQLLTEQEQKQLGKALGRSVVIVKPIKIYTLNQ